MEQGRRAVLHALGLPPPSGRDLVPTGIYTIPELASVGMSEAEAVERHGAVRIGRARFDELARGQINGSVDGLLKLVTDADGRRVLGVQVIGEHAAEIVHLGHMAMVADLPVDAFVDQVFNFPTYAEAYRVAALDVIGQRVRAARAA
jgi:NAD(P) transhydrogenase